MHFRAPLSLFALSVCASPALAGPDWIEGGFIGGPDAGSILETAQPVTGVGQLTTIFGSLSSGTTIDGGVTQPDFEDMYLIRIDVPGTFRFEVTGAQFDAQLFLFNITLPGEAFGLLANKDTSTSNAPLLMRPATDGTGADVLLPGTYAIAISGGGRVPVSMTGEIFNFVSPTEISGPDGPGGLNPHIGWTGEGAVGTYAVEMTDIGYVAIPAPGTLAVLLGGAGGLARRRRR